MKKFHFQLEKYKGIFSRYTCPQCKKSKEYTRYVNTQTNEYLPYQYGLCNRKDKCGYHLVPPLSLDIADSKIETVEIAPKEAKYIASSLLKQSLESKLPNHFKDFISKLHPLGESVLELYKVGTSKKWKGACIFWQIDKDERVSRGKIMLYDNFCKRVKKCISSVHHELEIKELLPSEELFGLWLAFEPENKDKTIALVESEKTAIIASLFLPEYLWMATGALDKLNSKRLENIKSRILILFPDLRKNNDSSFSWEKKGEELKTLGFSISTNSFLEKYASQKEKEEGLDIADYLLTCYFRENLHLKQVFGKKIYDFYAPPFHLESTRLLASQKEYFLHQADFFQNNLYQKPYYPIISKFYEFLVFRNSEEDALTFLLEQRKKVKERNETLETWIHFLQNKYTVHQILKYYQDGKNNQSNTGASS